MRTDTFGLSRSVAVRHIFVFSVCLVVCLGLCGGEPVGVDVGFEVVDGVEGLIPEEGERTGGEGADEEGTEQAWSVGDGDGVDIVGGVEVFGVVDVAIWGGVWGDFRFEVGVSCEEVLAVFSNAGLEEGLVDDWQNNLKVGAGGDFGDDATISGENIDLGDDDVAEEIEVRGGDFAGDMMKCVSGLG